MAVNQRIGGQPEAAVQGAGSAQAVLQVVRLQA